MPTMANESVIHWVGLALTSAVAILAIGGNLWTVLGRKPGSLAPFIGGVCGMYTLATGPFPALRPYWWVPLVIDAGSIPTVSGYCG